MNNKSAKCTSRTPPSSRPPQGRRSCLPIGGYGGVCVFSRTVCLRMLLVISLVIAAGVCASISYTTIRRLERQIGQQTYESVAALALEGAAANLERKFRGAQTMAKIMSFAFPDAAAWPMVSLDGYTEINKHLARISASTEHALMPIVRPGQEARDFEALIQQEYAEQGFAAHVGMNDFGFGIFKVDPGNSPYEDGRVHDVDGETDYNSTYKIMTPVVYTDNKESPFFLYNAHSTESRGRSIDSMIHCSERAKAAAAAVAVGATSAQNNHTTTATASLQQQLTAPLSRTKPPSCTTVTDMYTMIHRDGPAGTIFTPIYPKHHPQELVGIIGTTVFWEDILHNIVPDYVDGLRAVILTTTQTYTFEIQHGVPVLLGEGDLHDPQFEDFARSVLLDTAGLDNTRGTASATYMLQVYPTAVAFTEFQTKSPLAVSLAFVAVIVTCAAIFLLYDFLMRHEVHQRKMVLEIKRRFVRFISHEIRTPLNTVCMGLELLESELGTNNGDDDLSCSDTLACRRGDHVVENDAGDVDQNQHRHYQAEDWKFCHDITRDVQENAEFAVSILDELLNYDKIETGTLRLEIGRVSIWALVEKSVRQFQIQAANKYVELTLTMQQLHKRLSELNTFDLEEETDGGGGSTGDRSSTSTVVDAANLNVIGDEMRLGQVIRNVISNALKFTPPNGTIDVSAAFIPDGLPKAAPIAATDEPSPLAGVVLPHTMTQTQPRAGAIRIMVKDSGAGMTKEQLTLLFREGMQFDANQLQNGGGSGLGLAISKGIVEQHKGTITVHSDGKGLGSTFVVELPLYRFSIAADEKDSADTATTVTDVSCGGQRQLPQPEQQGQGLRKEQEIQPPGHGAATATGPLYPAQAPSTATKPQGPRCRRVLVVEDVLSNRKLLVRLLERLGHSCATAEHGKIAVELVANDMAAAAAALQNKNEDFVPFDTILIDSEMPVMSGPIATQRIRQMGFNATIFGVTGNLLQEDIDHFISMGANEVLPKPINMKILNRYWEKYPLPS